jgi:hypothetical protein
MPWHANPPVIIDIEASGFGAQSYPIEIGLVTSAGEKYCSLIRPLSEWTHWDEQAQSVHGVSRESLQLHGRPVAEVAARLNALLRKQTAYSDGWVVDQAWLNRLFHAAALPCEFSFSALDLILTEAQMEIWHQTKEVLLRELGDRRHRASFDAFLVQETWRRTKEATTARSVRSSGDADGSSSSRVG